MILSGDISGNEVYPENVAANSVNKINCTRTNSCGAGYQEPYQGFSSEILLKTG